MLNIASRILRIASYKHNSSDLSSQVFGGLLKNVSGRLVCRGKRTHSMIDLTQSSSDWITSMTLMRIHNILDDNHVLLRCEVVGDQLCWTFGILPVAAKDRHSELKKIKLTESRGRPSDSSSFGDTRN
jgi:hypothetical protein